MMVSEISIFLGVIVALSVVFSLMLSGHSRYQRDKELIGRPVLVRTTRF